MENAAVRALRGVLQPSKRYEFHQIQDEVKKITQEIPEKVLAGHSYHAADVHQWTTDISSQCLKELKGVANGSAGFKYIVNCTILQKRNAGYHTNSSCFWDAERDGSVSIRWENATMTCVLTVYCVSLQ
ncbi:Dynein light chain Tctex-type [Phytophthora pseudosyringae]|uniref:Dynein light chain Tctex-type n=1 Tax=Phytophthora pseudosyringae TaxID=221518 RepID=A0A8T1WI10_9STRA|nr:Dynein light chain Tctex-type [Phytophthora pseudosyringae]